MLSNDERKAIRERCNKATEGPWQTRFIYRLFRAARESVVVLMRDGLDKDWPNADFIAHARTDLPAALDEIERLEREVERLRDALTWLSGRFDYGVAGLVAHHYQEAIAMLLFGPAKDWDEALSVPCDDDYPFTYEERVAALRALREGGSNAQS